MIRDCTPADFDSILAIINDAAQVYRGVIPSDRWKEPYMPGGELRHEMAAGVAFVGHEGPGGGLDAVMGIQPVEDVVLIRHAYVRRASQRRGVGAELLRHLTATTDRPVLLGTWRAARWAIRFYEKNGFRLVDGEVKDRLLRRYWDIPPRQVETSVVLADPVAAAKFLPQRRTPGSEAAEEEDRDGQR